MDPFSLSMGAAASSGTTGGSKDLGRARSNIDDLRKQVGEQRLLIEVLVRALIEKGLYTRAQLNALANLIDVEDGVRDGRLTPQKGVKHCSNCGRVRVAGSGTCLYCEHEDVLEIV